MYSLFTTASSTRLVASVVSAVGTNFDALAIIAALAAGVPLAFYVLKRVIGLFPKR